jgi:TetR/AcrR family transcriptional regulator, transcriptional repressor for nem operon
MRKGNETRERILDIAEAAVLAKGFGATSIEELIAEAGITKSGFFYHFQDKNELARGLLVRYGEQNDRLLSRVFGRAKDLTDDPLQQLLIGLNLFAEYMAELPAGHPGCLVATMSYQDRLFDREVRTMVTDTVTGWNGFFCEMIEAVLAAYTPREAVDADKLARTICCAIDGAIIMAKALCRPDVLPEQVLMVRQHIKLVFAGAVPRVSSSEAIAA